jgi:hypothetical protein
MVVIEVLKRWRQPRGPPDETATNRESVSCPGMADPFIWSTRRRAGQRVGLCQPLWRGHSARQTCAHSLRKSAELYMQSPPPKHRYWQLPLRLAARWKRQSTKPHSPENADRGFLHERLSYA